MKPRYTFIDLFAGCGGLTEGFYRQKFIPLAHVEFDKSACCKTYKEFVEHMANNERVLQMKLTEIVPDLTIA